VEKNPALVDNKVFLRRLGYLLPIAYQFWSLAPEHLLTRKPDFVGQVYARHKKTG
jgi:hypothetical protein